MAETDLDSLVASVPSEMKIPPQPEVLRRLKTEIDGHNTNVDRIAQIVSRDVGISSEILRIVNSSFFGLPTTIQSIPHAISVLGVEPTRNLSAGILLKAEFDDRGISFPRFWDSAANIADLSAFLAHRLTSLPTDLLFTMGLFHDVGIPLLAQCCTDYMDVLSKANASTEGRFTDHEDEQFGVNHAVIGAAVTEEWGLSRTLRDIILHHHEVDEFFANDTSPSREDSHMLAILKLAEMGNSVLRQAPTDPDWNRFGESVKDLLNVSQEDIDSLIDEFRNTSC